MQQTKNGRKVVVIIDEAQGLADRVLEQMQVPADKVLVPFELATQREKR
jgi:type II secretory pathway predicted ATPase ExeA